MGEDGDPVRASVHLPLVTAEPVCMCGRSDNCFQSRDIKNGI